MLIQVNITLMKDFVKFSVEGAMGSGSVTLKQTSSVDDEDSSTVINIDSPVSLDFAVKYLKNFSTAASLSPRVTLHLSNEIPMLVEFKIEDLGYLRYYLAAKISDDADMPDIPTKDEDDY